MSISRKGVLPNSHFTQHELAFLPSKAVKHIRDWMLSFVLTKPEPRLISDCEQVNAEIPNPHYKVLQIERTLPGHWTPAAHSSVCLCVWSAHTRPGARRRAAEVPPRHNTALDSPEVRPHKTQQENKRMPFALVVISIAGHHRPTAWGCCGGSGAWALKARGGGGGHRFRRMHPQPAPSKAPPPCGPPEGEGYVPISVFPVLGTSTWRGGHVGLLSPPPPFRDPILFFRVPALGVCSSPSKGPQPRARGPAVSHG